MNFRHSVSLLNPSILASTAFAILLYNVHQPKSNFQSPSLYSWVLNYRRDLPLIMVPHFLSVPFTIYTFLSYRYIHYWTGFPLQMLPNLKILSFFVRYVYSKSISLLSLIAICWFTASQHRGKTIVSSLIHC